MGLAHDSRAMTNVILEVSAMSVLWFSSVPKLGVSAYKGPTGWHETVAMGDATKNEVPEAIRVCREH